MISTLRNWRRAPRLFCFALSFSLPLAASRTMAQNAPDAATSSNQTQEVDAATKQLMAANGLFQRSLFKLAAEQYSEFLDANPRHAQVSAARYALSVCQMRLGTYDKAIDSLGPVLQDNKFEQRDEALAVLGYCELVSKHYDRAQGAFWELLTKYPQSKQRESAACYQAQALYLGGDAKKAAVACEAFLGTYAKSDKRSTALYFLGLSRKSLGEHDRAIEALAELLRDEPNSAYKVDALLLCGQSYEAQNKLEPAVTQYRQMLAAAPDARKPDAHYSLGVALYKTASYDLAAKELSAVVDEFPKSAYVKPAKLHLGLAQLAGNHIAEARRTLDAVSREDNTRSVDARYGLSQCDIADKQWEPARRTLDELAHLQPAPANLPQVLIDRAVCQMELGKYQDAANEFATFRSEHANAPQVPEAIYRQAFCLHRLAKYDQSHVLCEQLAKLPASEMSVASSELDAENLFLLTKYPDAERAFNSLAASTKDEAKRPRFKLREAQCEYFAGNYPKAVELLQPLAADPKTAQSEELRPAIFLCGDAQLQLGKNAEAAEMLKRFVLLSKGDTREAKFKLARAQLGAKDKDAAGQTLAELTQGPTDSPWVQRGLLEQGQLQYKAGNADRAAASLERLLAANAAPELSAPAIYLLGWIDFDSKHFAEAASRWNTLKERFPKHALVTDAAFQRGVALKEAGKLDEALAALQAFAAEHADNANAPKARQLAAAVLTAQGKNDQAARLLTELAGSSSASDTVLYDLAWSQRNNKDLTAAKETYRKFLTLHADSKLLPAVRTELAELLYSDKGYAEATDLLERVTADKSVDAKILAPATYRLGFCYEKQSKWDKAAVAFTDFADHFPDDNKLAASALLQSGIASAEQGKFDQAEHALSRMLTKYRESDQAPVALLKLGEAQAEQQEFEPSLHTYRDFLGRFEKNEFAYRAQFGAGWALENLKKFEEAREAYKKVIAATNGETAARAQFQIGETLLAEQKFEQAVLALLAVEDVYAYPAWSARALLEAGRAFEQLHQSDNAKQQYTQLLTKYKSSAEAGLAQERMKAL